MKERQKDPSDLVSSNNKLSQFDQMNRDLAEIEQQSDISLSDAQQRRLLAYSTVMTEPHLIQQHAEELGVSVNMFYTYTTEVIESTQLRNLGIILREKTEKRIDLQEQIIFSPEEIKIRFRNDFKKALQKPEMLLKDTELPYFKLHSGKKSPEEIAEVMDCTVGNVYKRWYYIRKKFETERFPKYDIHRAADYGSNVQNAASDQTIGAEKLFSIYYTNDENAALTEGRRRIPDQDLVAQGYVPLVEHVDHDEYAVFKVQDQYAPFIKRSGNIIYVQKKSLPYMRSIKRTRTHTDHPPEGFVPLKETYGDN